MSVASFWCKTIREAGLSAVAGDIEETLGTHIGAMHRVLDGSVKDLDSTLGGRSGEIGEALAGHLRDIDGALGTHVDAKTKDARFETAVSGVLASSDVGFVAITRTPNRLDTKTKPLTIERTCRLMAWSSHDRR